MADKLIKVCKFCGYSESYIRMRSKRLGRRYECFLRGTPKGFHKYYITKEV